MAASNFMTDILPDVLEHDLALLFCGTAASEVSARAGAYYANKGNAFWSTLYAVGITSRQLYPKEFRDLLKLKIGLTDLVKRVSGSDRALAPGDFQPKRLHDSICRFQPQIVAFTSKAAWRAWKRMSPRNAASYGWQDETLNKTRFFVLPSPSGAARGYWDIKHWRALADEYQRRLPAN
jgi:TDG/mug DNA glycosylase family protein